MEHGNVDEKNPLNTTKTGILLPRFLEVHSHKGCLFFGKLLVGVDFRSFWYYRIWCCCVEGAL